MPPVPKSRGSEGVSWVKDHSFKNLAKLELMQGLSPLFKSILTKSESKFAESHYKELCKVYGGKRRPNQVACDLAESRGA